MKQTEDEAIKLEEFLHKIPSQKMVSNLSRNLFNLSNNASLAPPEVEPIRWTSMVKNSTFIDKESDLSPHQRSRNAAEGDGFPRLQTMNSPHIIPLKAKWMGPPPPKWRPSGEIREILNFCKHI